MYIEAQSVDDTNQSSTEVDTEQTNDEVDENSSDSEEEMDDLPDELMDVDFELEEDSSIFESFASVPKHMKCIAHKLQLVLKDAFERDPDMINLRKVKLTFQSNM